ncbi:MAG: hypothetical protein AVDCRST_MAG57-189, partial [uncultured Blastococcus sp.]
GKDRARQQQLHGLARRALPRGRFRAHDRSRVASGTAAGLEDREGVHPRPVPRALAHPGAQRPPARRRPAGPTGRRPRPQGAGRLQRPPGRRRARDPVLRRSRVRRGRQQPAERVVAQRSRHADVAPPRRRSEPGGTRPRPAAGGARRRL